MGGSAGHQQPLNNETGAERPRRGADFGSPRRGFGTCLPVIASDGSPRWGSKLHVCGSLVFIAAKLFY